MNSENFLITAVCPIHGPNSSCSSHNSRCRQLHTKEAYKTSTVIPKKPISNPVFMALVQDYAIAGKTGSTVQEINDNCSLALKNILDYLNTVTVDSENNKIWVPEPDIDTKIYSPVAQVRTDVERADCVWFGPVPPHGTLLYTTTDSSVPVATPAKVTEPCYCPKCYVIPGQTIPCGCTGIFKTRTTPCSKLRLHCSTCNSYRLGTPCYKCGEPTLLVDYNFV